MLPPDLQRLEHIRDYCYEIEKDMEKHNRSETEFYSNKTFQRSVILCLMQIGELCRGLSDEYKDRTSYVVPWVEVRALRNVIVHHYGKIVFSSIWNTLIDDIPALKAFCESQLAAFDEHNGG